MIDDEFTKTFLEKKGFLSKRESFDCLTMDCPSDKLVELVLSLRDEENFDLLVDLTAIDHGEEAQVRFSVVLHFYSLVQRGYLRFHAACAPTTRTLPSLRLPKFTLPPIGMRGKLTTCSESSSRDILISGVS